MLLSFQRILPVFCKFIARKFGKGRERSFLIYVSSVAAQTISSNKCSMTVVETKNDICPNASTFNIMTEYDKPADAWRIDFNVGIVLHCPSNLSSHSRNYEHKVSMMQIKSLNSF